MDAAVRNATRRRHTAKSGIEYMRDACIMVFRREQGVGEVRIEAR